MSTSPSPPPVPVSDVDEISGVDLPPNPDFATSIPLGPAAPARAEVTGVTDCGNLSLVVTAAHMPRDSDRHAMTHFLGLSAKAPYHTRELDESHVKMSRRSPRY